MAVNRLFFKSNQLISIPIFNKIYKTKPVDNYIGENCIVLSMVQHKDMAMYLMALKTFFKYCPAKKVIVIADQSLTNNDKKVLSYHIPQLTIFDVNEFCSKKIPQGGCWERLYAISKLVKDAYVIQLDADTLTLGAVSEILTAVKENKGFLIGTQDNQAFQSLENYAKTAKVLLTGKNDQIQTIAEAHLDLLPGKNGRYVKGSAAFSGFPKGSFSSQDLEKFSIAMNEIIGSKWEDWGSEQFASNYIVSNFAESFVLPHPKYCAVHRRNAKSIFLHFPGYVRYKGGAYLKYGYKILKQLS